MVGRVGQGGSYIRLVFTTSAGNSIMGKMNPSTRKCTQAEGGERNSWKHSGKDNPAQRVTQSSGMSWEAWQTGD